MKKSVFCFLTMMLTSVCAFGVDGTVLINQSTVIALGGFPYTISAPGSYRLSGNLTVPNAATTAVVIAADNVTLDLNGLRDPRPNGLHRTGLCCDIVQSGGRGRWNPHHWAWSHQHHSGQRYCEWNGVLWS